MAIKPIPLKTWEVQAILRGDKTTTRRVVKKRYSNTDLYLMSSQPYPGPACGAAERCAGPGAIH